MCDVHAPELEPALGWLNTDHPLRLRALRGHVVVLHFFTYGCVESVHALSVVEALARRYARAPVAVIGVHSARFAGEASVARVADALARHHVTHPVAVDVGRDLWERYALRGWPTVAVLRPDGTLASVEAGAPDADALDAAVAGLLGEGLARGTLAAERVDTRFAPDPWEGTLHFPSGVAVAPDGRVAIADTGHHRVLVTDGDGAVLVAVGNGRAGLVDGDVGFARFRGPQGVAWSGEQVWVADTGNHCVRVIDLDERVVTRVAGTGQRGALDLREPAPARSVALRAPWGVAVDDARVIVSMAGARQLWAYDLEDGMLSPWSGSGREALLDGSHAGAAYAQPAGLARRNGTLYVADSGASAVRAVELTSGSAVTLTGAGLADFGDADGPIGSARMQHPLAVAVAGDGAVLVADTYNDAIRRIDMERHAVTTLYRGDGEHALREPAALATRDDGAVLVCDTGHHRVVELDAHGRWVRELAVTGAPSVTSARDDEEDDA